MNGLSDLKWEETDTDISTSDLTPEEILSSCNGRFPDAISKRGQQWTQNMRKRMDTLFQARIMWTCSDADSENSEIIKEESSNFLINSQTGVSLSGMTKLGLLERVSHAGTLSREEELITFHLRLTMSSKSFNGYAVDIRGKNISSSISLEVPSGINHFTLDWKQSKTDLFMILDIQLNCVTFGDAKYWF